MAAQKRAPSFGATASLRVRRPLLCHWVVALVAVLALGGCPAMARAARVVVLSRDGRATERNDPFLPRTPMSPRAGVAAGAGVVPPARVAVDRTVRGELGRLY